MSSGCFRASKDFCGILAATNERVMGYRSSISQYDSKSSKISGKWGLDKKKQRRNSASRLIPVD